jgi:hypothetical protein
MFIVKFNYNKNNIALLTTTADHNNNTSTFMLRSRNTCNHASIYFVPRQTLHYTLLTNQNQEIPMYINLLFGIMLYNYILLTFSLK